MGVVWQAERVGIERPVVVKFLQQVLSDRPGAVDRFEREARATARLNHPNCVQLVDFGLDEGQPYLVVEFVEGQTLAEQLDHGPLPAKRAVRIAAQVLAGLEHAHERGILHRVLKPANLMLVEAAGYEDFVKILDFGLAKVLGEADRREVTVHGVALGTPGYMSPEQAAGMPSDARADMYSVGAVIYHLLTGVKVFEGGNVHSILRKHREDTPPPPRSLRGPSAISAELDAVVAKAMQRDPEKRYQTALQMRRALEATPEGKQLSTGVQGVTRQAAFATDNSPTTVARPTQRGMPPMARSRSALPLVLIVAFGLAAIATAGALFLYRYRQSHRSDAVVTRPIDRVPPGQLDGGRQLANDAASTPVQVVSLTFDGSVAEADAAVSAAALAPPTLPDRTTAPQGRETEDEGDGSEEDVSAAPSPPLAAPRRETRDVTNLGDVRVLIRRGETDLALAGLYQLRRKAGGTRERQAQIAVLLGHLYNDRHWVSDALKEYRYALSLDGRLRSDPTVVGNTVRALTDRVTAPRARRLILDSVGRSAIVPLRRLADRPDTRRRAEEILAKLGAPRR